MTLEQPTHVVAIFGGACSGSVAAEALAERGCQVIVFEQNDRPYGKIEDGLPRWHDKQRSMEYGKIDERLRRPGVTFVPRTRLGRDLDFADVATRWGFSAVVLANGAWKDRPLEVAGADEAEGRGLIYQNPFIHWFNHKDEPGWSGPRFEVEDGAVVVGGGLASIDVIKVLQLELYARALRARGHEVDVVAMEHEGIPKALAALGVDPAALGVRGATLVYRRRIDDMPLSPGAPAGATDAQKAKVGVVRQKLLGKAQERFLFHVRPLTLPRRLVLEGGRVTGLEVSSTEVVGRDVRPVAGSEEVLATTQVHSSIGSIPEPIPGVEMQGVYYRFTDEATGAYGPLEGVFGAGNVVTGQGNIKASLDHGKQVAAHLLERVLAPTGDPVARGEAAGAALAAAVAGHVATRAPLAAAAAEALLARARARQAEVGYAGYDAWIARHAPGA